MKNTKYMNPYLAGFLLGLLLLLTIYITGHGLGASGAAKNVVIYSLETIAPTHSENVPFLQDFNKTHEGSPLKAWLVFEVLGALLGAFISGTLANRLKLKVEHHSGISSKTRLVAALIGGALFGLGSQLGRGCTSGAALSGMAVFSTGGILTMLAIFGGGYLFAYFFRKLWIN